MYRESLIEIARMVWGPALEVTSDSQQPPAAGLLAAEVCFSGNWYGFVSAAVSVHLAQHAASSLFRVEPNGLAAEDVTDALKEMVNMLGGNLKALLPPPVRLALPRLVDTPIVISANHGYVLGESVTLRCGNEVMQLALGASPLPLLPLL